MATFATLKPTNPLAQLAFSDLYDLVINGRQDVDERERVFRISPNPQRVYDENIAAFERHIHRRALGKQDADAGEVSDTLPDTQSVAGDHADDPGWIWQGHFLLSFDPPPSDSGLGWTVGK